tara:strand:+ start:4715 stop:5056 length:342 start_codon:yes stop_codon:yes gene_type:complete
MEYIEPFLLGGSLIAGSKLLSHYVSPEFAPLVGGLPTGILSSLFLVGNENKRKYYKGYLVSGIIITLSVISINLISKTYPQMNVNTISIVAIICWAIVSFFAIRFEKHVLKIK